MPKLRSRWRLTLECRGARGQVLDRSHRSPTAGRMLKEGNTQRFWYWVIHQNRLPPKKIKHNSIMMDFDLFVAEKLQELRESSGSKKGVLPRPGYNSRWARKGTIAFSLSFFGMLLQFSDHFLDQHEKLWNFRCRFEHKHVVVNVFFPRGCPPVIYHIYHTENPKVKPWIFHIYV